MEAAFLELSELMSEKKGKCRIYRVACVRTHLICQASKKIVLFSILQTIFPLSGEMLKWNNNVSPKSDKEQEKVKLKNSAYGYTRRHNEVKRTKKKLCC